MSNTNSLRRLTFAKVTLWYFIYCRFVEQQGLHRGAHQSMGEPEKSVVPAEHGAERRRAAGAQSRALLRLRSDLL